MVPWGTRFVAMFVSMSAAARRHCACLRNFQKPNRASPLRRAQIEFRVAKRSTRDRRHAVARRGLRNGPRPMGVIAFPNAVHAF